jgi:predicted dehydrogenase
MKKILIIGYGSIGSRHLNLLRMQIPDADIRIYRHKNYDFIPEGADGVFYDFSQAINFKPHFSIISNPSIYHIPISIELAKNNINMIIEKPLSNNLDRINELKTLVSTNNIKVLLGYNLRFYDSLIKFRSLLNDGYIGKIYSVDCCSSSYLPNWRPNINYRDSVSAQSNLGGGVLLELSHEIDYLRWIFGNFNCVQSHVATLSNLDLDVEDSVNALINARNINGDEIFITLNINFISPQNRRYCSVTGSKGTIIWDGLNNTINYYPLKNEKYINLYDVKFNQNESYVKELQHFLECLDQNKKPLISIEDGIQVLKIIEALKKSSIEKKAIYL